MDSLPLQSSNNANVLPAGAGRAGKTIEETYQKKTQLEHILLRPDTYVGSIEKYTQKLWIYRGNEMVYEDITYVPGLYKIFDEILVNAADNKQRDPTMNTVKVNINPERNEISVYNNGDGVPVEIHKEHGVYVPELIFGHLLTSSNYDDSVKKTTGGRNGYGAKLTNIFSTEFIIETADGKRQKKYKQVFADNMGKKSEPVVTKCKTSENWTKVTFKPDLAKFKLECLEEDVVALMRKRVVDLAGCLGKGVIVELNGQRVPVKSFSEYVDLYVQAKSGEEKPPRFMFSHERWEICVSISNEGQFQQVSFVNGIATVKGGTHVDYITNQVTQYVVEVVNKKKKNANIKAPAVKSHLWVFVNVLIDNPAFDSQTKETLTTRPNSFGCSCKLPDDFLKKVVSKSPLVESLISWADFKQSKDLKKTDGAKRQRLVGIPKLEDANEAGGKNSTKCTLILTEGDSAKALAMAGLAVVGRDYYGVFPLKGKMLNVREATHKQILENAEIQNLKKILGLQQAKMYESVSSLRYGHLMIMTDQDHDGSHIKGLIINFIHAFWPSLLKIPSFVVEFVTPLLKATNKRNRQVLAFYSMHEYDAWVESLNGNMNGWTIKYYKGLGTSSSTEGKEYFKDLDRHKKDFVWSDDSQDTDAIELAFSKKKIEARKNWLRQYEPGSGLDSKDKYIKYTDFVHKELIQFSIADLQRSIPSVMDGLKPGQRKVLFCAFKRNLIKETKISQFGGYVAEKSAYHHGDQSLYSTIIGMAQDFGGKDHASPRYINTCLENISRFIFPKEDDVLLDYLREDGLTVEPSWYAPIIPMVLVNGSEGIGTGWSSYIPNFNPRDIIANIRRLLNDQTMVPMDPWYRGFKGTIEKSTKECSYTVCGTIEEIDEGTLRITELPVRRWTQDYKQFLESIIESNDKPKDGDKVKERFIKDFRDHSTDTVARFEIYMDPEKLLMAKQEGLMKKFKLTTSMGITNMHLFDPRGLIKKYADAEQILEEFYHLRLDLYEKRKKYYVDNLQKEVTKLENKVRFILAVINEEVVVNRKKKAALVSELWEKGFTPIPKKAKSVESAVVGADDNEETGDSSERTDPQEEQVNSQGVRVSDYDYLLSMSIVTLTYEKIEELCSEKDKVSLELDEMKKLTPRSLWSKDLDALEGALDEQDKNDAQKSQEDLRQAGAKASKQPARKPRKVAPKTVSSESVAGSTMTFAASVMDIDNDAQEAKPKGRGRPKKAPVKKATVFEDDEEDLEPLRARLAAYNIESDNSPVNEIQEQDPPAATKNPRKTAPRKKVVNLDDDSDEDDTVNDDSDDDFEVEAIVPTKGKGRGRGRGATAAKTTIGATAAKKRGKQSQVIGQKLITDVLKPTSSQSSGVSPEKKMRRMRASPFNKKSSSVLGRMQQQEEEEASPSSEGNADSNSASQLPARPRRAAAAKQNTIVLSSSEDDEDEDEDEDEEEHFDDESDVSEDDY
ncbi:hypothetical protein V2J09_023293 [Rumex salicifolius]